MDDKVTFKRVSDETRVDFKGDVERVRRYDFFIGTHGPFTERVPLENFSENEITLRIQKLKAHLQAVSR
jgi:hypothetical protein